MKRTVINLFAGIFCCITFFAAMPVQSAVAIPQSSSFVLDWQGFNGNAAHGMLAIDNALFPNPSNGVAFLTPGIHIVDFSLNVFNADSGVTSIYTLTDFDLFVWDSLDLLDLSQELVGQEIENKGFWGPGFVNGDAGDFSFFAVEGSGAPSSDGSNFYIATNEGLGDVMRLTSFRPVPLPAAFWLFGSALLGLTRFGFRRHISLA